MIFRPRGPLYHRRLHSTATLEFDWALTYHFYMVLALDTSRQFRSVSELAELVRAISSAPSSESEPDWLEWKREADLTDRHWTAQIARYIAGFANRDPVVAKGWAGGCSYLVLGVEPGNVGGVSPIDNATLHAGISRFVRERVRWSPSYVQHEGNQILVIIVEPPEPGDHIVAMLTDFQSHERGARGCRKGDVFIRRHGKTELAGQEDYDMLLQRFAASAARVSDISVQVLGAVTAEPVACGADAVAARCQRLEHALLEPLEQGAERGKSSTPGLNFENRSPEEYRRQVESYVTKVAPLLPAILRSAVVINRTPGLQLVVINETDQNFAGVRVEVTIEREVWAYRSAEDARPEMPRPPRKWGSAPELNLPGMNMVSRLDMPDLWGPSIDNSGSARIEFPDDDLRPNARVELDPIHLVCDAGLAGEVLTGNWTATSSTASGVVRGEFPIQVPSNVASPGLDQT